MLPRVRLAVPASAMRSSVRSTSVSSSTVASDGHRRRAARRGPARAWPGPACVVSLSSSPPSRSLISWRSSTTSSCSIGPGSSTSRCSTRPVSVIMTSMQPRGRDRHQLEVADPAAGQARVLHDGDLAGELGQQPHGAVHHIVEVDRADQEPLDRPPLGRRERLDPGEPVDEEPVALVGRHPARAGVRLAEVALLLQHRHVVAYGGRRDAQVVPLDQRLAADRLLGRDVVLDDGAQDLQLAVVERHVPPSEAIVTRAGSTPGTPVRRVPVYVDRRRNRDARSGAAHRAAWRDISGPAADLPPDCAICGNGPGRSQFLGQLSASLLVPVDPAPLRWRHDRTTSTAVGVLRRRAAGSSGHAGATADHHRRRLHRRHRRLHPPTTATAACTAAVVRVGPTPTTTLSRRCAHGRSHPPPPGYANSDEKTWALIAHFGGHHRRRLHRAAGRAAGQGQRVADGPGPRGRGAELPDHLGRRRHHRLDPRRLPASSASVFFLPFIAWIVDHRLRHHRRPQGQRGPAVPVPDDHPAGEVTRADRGRSGAGRVAACP